MNVIFTRHAKRRMKLYNISKSDVINVLKSLKSYELNFAKNEVIATVNKFVYPIKVIFEKKKEGYVIITAYPLKRGRNENTL